MPPRMLFRHSLRPASTRLPSIAALPTRPRYNSSLTTANSSSNTGAPFKSLQNILIANRGEIALRVSRTASLHGVRTTTVYTEPDKFSQHALVTPHSVNIGPPSAYLDVEKIIKAAKENGCDSVHPGYGFLSENSGFAKRCKEEGLVFIGPPPDAIEAMGNKSESKNIMLSASVPCIPGYHGTNQDPNFLLSEAGKIGFPVLIKAVKGGGGKGMRISTSKSDFLDQLESAKSEARSSFGNDVVLVEKYITTPRHIEVQVFADAHGNCVALGERDCSVQRRHQKILEESPAPDLDPAIRKDIWQKARAAALAVGYQGAGTVEFIFDNDTGEFFFMEMNTRLQVEHPVTEMVTGQDLVHWQLLVAAGHPLPLTQEEIEAQMTGHAFEARIYAENPDMGFIPDSGKLIHLRTPTPSDTVRIDAGFGKGDVVSSHYDPMIAKLIVKGADRQGALMNLRAALEEYEVVGMETNIEFLKKLAVHPAFVGGEVETGFIDKHRESLFKKLPTPPEVYAQAGLAMLMKQNIPNQSNDPYSISGGGVGFAGGLQERKFQFTETRTNPNSTEPPAPVVEVALKQQPGSTSQPSYEVTVSTTSPNAPPPIKYSNVTPTSSADAPSSITTFYPHTRLTTTTIPSSLDPSKLTLFHLGTKYNLTITPPPWATKALGTGSSSAPANSIVAPMPCKVLRVNVQAGDVVEKDQPLVVVESMKMEMVIRAPRGGSVVKRVVKGVGEMVPGGGALVEFEETEAEAGA